MSAQVVQPVAVEDVEVEVEGAVAAAVEVEVPVRDWYRECL
jgi:hypothetical protein